MALYDPWLIEKYAREKAEKDLLKRLGMQIDIYGTPNTDQVPFYCFQKECNVFSEISNTVKEGNRLSENPENINEYITDYSV